MQWRDGEVKPILDELPDVPREARVMGTLLSATHMLPFTHFGHSCPMVVLPPVISDQVKGPSGHGITCWRDQSAYKCDPLLSFALNRSAWLRRQLKNCSLLAFSHTCQEHDLTVRKFQRIMVSGDLLFIDLPKDRRLVLDHLIPPTQHTDRLARNPASKGQLGSGSNADCHARVFWRSKSLRARTKVARRQLVTNFRRARFDAVKAVVAHLGPLPLESPSANLSYPFSPPSASTSNPTFGEHGTLLGGSIASLAQWSNDCSN